LTGFDHTFNHIDKESKGSEEVFMRAPFLLTGLAVLPLIFTTAPALAQPKIPVRAAYVPAVTWLPAWVAQDEGIFAKNGLDVSFTEIQNLGLLPSTLGKQFDVAPSTPPDLIKAAGNGINVVAVAGGFIESSDRRSIEILTKADSGIKKAADLSGKLIATPALGSIMHVATLQWLKKNGVNPTSVRAVEVPFPNMADQLESGRVQAVEAIQPFAGLMMKNGAITLADPILSIADPAMATMWISDKSWATAHKDVIEKWIASLKESITIIDQKPESVRGSLAKYTKLKPEIAARIPIPAYQATIAPKDLVAWIDVLREMGQVSAPISAENLVMPPK
jgi:ABC-type nitrate/sulfonate/bicarbonate transport system substrate-binding protein